MTFQRFKGPNALFQMLAMLESASPGRRDHLLKSMNSENPAMASLLRTKVLTVERIFGWPIETLKVLTSELGDEACLGIIEMLRDHPGAMAQFRQAVGQERMHRAQGHLKLREGTHSLSQGQLDAVRMQVLMKVRELERLGQLDIQSVDPAAAVPSSDIDPRAA